MKDDLGKMTLPAALVKRLGKFPFWRGDIPLLDAVEPIYNRASTEALNVFLASND